MPATIDMPRPPDGLPFPRRFRAIVAVSLGSALTTLDSSIVTVALPTLARDLHVAPSAAVLVVTVYQLVLMMTLLPLAALGDRFGHRPIYQGGQLLFVVATALCFFAKSLPFLVLVRAFQALGSAAVLSVASAMATNPWLWGDGLRGAGGIDRCARQRAGGDGAGGDGLQYELSN